MNGGVNLLGWDTNLLQLRLCLTRESPYWATAERSATARSVEVPV